MPGSVEMKNTVSIAHGLKYTDRDYVTVPVSEVVAYLRKNKECYERTLPLVKDSPINLNCVYIDIDGEADWDMEEGDFTILTTKLETAIVAFAEAEGYASVMEANKWRGSDGEGTTFNKLSYRLNMTSKMGTKAAIAHYVKTVAYPHLKAALADILPVNLILKKKGKTDYTDQLIVDLSVYNPGQRKMRMLGQSKPFQERPNLLIYGRPEDTLITHSSYTGQIEILPVPMPISTFVAPPPPEPAEDTEGSVGLPATVSSDPEEDDTEAVELMMEVLDKIDQSRWDYYPDWIRIAFILFNEGQSLETLIKLSRKSSRWETGSPDWITKIWAGLHRGSLTQALLWNWLAEDNADAYNELMTRRRDFWNLIHNANHAETARFFYNLKPDAYVYNERLGWFQLRPNNIWKHYEQKPNGILQDIWLSFKKIVKEHQKQISFDQTNEVEAKAAAKKLTALRRFAASIGNKTFCDGVIAFLPSCYNDDELDKKMDESRHLLAFKDAVYDLDKDQHREIVPEDWICLNTGYPFPRTRSPTAKKALLQCIRSCFETTAAIEESEDIGNLTLYVLKTIASCLHGTKKWEQFYVWTGSGGNGKGMISDLVKRAMGDYYHSIPHSCLTKIQDKKDAPNPAMAKAKGKRFVQASEPEAEDKLQCGVIKELSGGDDVTARDMYRSTITYKPQFGLFLQTNAIPKLNRADGGVQRRLRVITFPFQFKEHPVESHEKPINCDLKDKIIKSPEWRDEMLHLLLDAFREIKAHGIEQPESVKIASQDYMDDNNPIKGWLESKYVIGLNANDRRFQIESSVIRQDYIADTNHQIGPDKFKACMDLCGIIQKKESHDYKTMRWAEFAKKYEMTNCKAGRYYCGLRISDHPAPE